jgi:deoxyribodipyrimidine photo-lyase
MTAYSRALHWFRRDLRDEDNAGLYYALTSSSHVHCVFVFDTAILDRLPDRNDRRVEFIHASVAGLGQSLRRRGGELVVLHGDARTEIPALAARLGVDAVFANADYEPAAIERDDAVREALAAQGRRMHLAKDQAIFDKDEVLSKAGRPFVVFTPYRNAWRAKLEPFFAKAYPIASHARRLAPPASDATMPSLESLGFRSTDLSSAGVVPGMRGARAALDTFAARLGRYAAARDFPAVQGTSMLSVHNRFGTASIRECARLALAGRGAGAATWLSELAWRDFFFQVLWHYPHVEHGAFRPEFDAIEWQGGEEELARWSEARTGYPIVDAAMRQLNATGFMHNRLRMIAASFLVKDLLVDWRRGERIFAERLNDYDLAANNGNWQWAASTGCDAQPWFRIFNPAAQSLRFDPRGKFIRQFVPELARVPDTFVHEPWKMPPETQRSSGCVIGRDYPAPVVDHASQRAKALAMFRATRTAPGRRA